MTPKGPVDTTAERIADDIDSHANSIRLLLLTLALCHRTEERSYRRCHGRW